MSKRRDKKKRARKVKEKVTGKKVVARGRPKPTVKIKPKVDRRKKIAPNSCSQCGGSGATQIATGPHAKDMRRCGHCGGSGIEPTHSAPDPVAKAKAVADALDPEMDAVDETELDRLADDGGGPVDPDFQ